MRGLKIGFRVAHHGVGADWVSMFTRLDPEKPGGDNLLSCVCVGALGLAPILERSSEAAAMMSFNPCESRLRPCRLRLLRAAEGSGL
jgi:hypothetical protein